MKTLTIAALSSVAILMGASAGFAATGPAQHVTAGQMSGFSQLAMDTNSERFRCNDALRGDGSSINPNINFCATGV